MSDYDKLMEYRANAKPVGKATLIYKGKAYRIDYDYNPPKIEEVER